jgi:hypothetical protein
VFAASDVNYASLQAFETVQLRPSFFCVIALRHRVFVAHSLEFVSWSHLQVSVAHVGYFFRPLGLLAFESEAKNLSRKFVREISSDRAQHYRQITI